MSSPSTAARSIIYLGMDVHKESMTIAVLPVGARVLTRLERVPNDLAKLNEWIDRVARERVGFLWTVMQELPVPI